VKIAIFGTGNVGGALGRRWLEVGQQVFFGAQDPDSEEVRRLLARCPAGTRVGHVADAAAEADVVLLAIPWDQTRQVLAEAGNLEGKVLLDCINPLLPDLSGLACGQTTSAAEQIADWVPAARVVKAFNTLSAAAMEDPTFGDQAAGMFYCGDDAQAKAITRELAEQLGFQAIDCGPLRLARQLEPFAMLYVHLAVFEGWGGECAFSILKR
jgi:8-hydroxy-5-deazaflavin:NADPH oxidoreductase